MDKQKGQVDKKNGATQNHENKCLVDEKNVNNSLSGNLGKSNSSSISKTVMNNTKQPGRGQPKKDEVDSSTVGGRRKRKASEADLAVRQELEELREWRRRAEEKEKQMNLMFSSSSSCIVCLDTRPDLVSYGACGHMVCIVCCLDHIIRKLMVLRRPTSQNTACKARLSHFALNVEDSEFSCPMCRQGQLDLMGAGLSLLPDFAYHQLANYCCNGTNAINKDTKISAIVAPQTTTTDTTTAVSAVLAPKSETLLDLSLTRRMEVLAQLERNRAAALKALQQQQQQLVVVNKGIQCPFCGIRAALPGETGPDKMLPSELLRHVWRCRKRTFRCGFADCKRPFSWESVYSTHAPTSVGSIGDFKSESKWLELVNAAFREHMTKDCLTKVTCCIGWCDWHKSPAKLSLCQFQDHETRHKLIHDRFQQVGSITEVAIQLERTLATLLRSEFNLLPPPPPPLSLSNLPLLAPPTPPTSLTNRLTTSATAAIPAGTAGPKSNTPVTTTVATQTSTTSTTAAAAAAASTATTAVGRPDVMSFAEPIAREIHNSLGALNDLLRSHVTPRGSTDEDGPGALSTGAVRCPLHGANGVPTAEEAKQALNQRMRTRLSAQTLDQLELELSSMENRRSERTERNVFIDDEDEAEGQVLESTESNEDDDDDDDDEDFVPDSMEDT